MTPIELENRYSARNYEPLPIMLTRGQGAYLWDTAGRRYIDMMSAYSAASHGHAHPRILAALETQARRLAVPSRAYYNDRLGPFLAELCRLTGFDTALPMNTGAEAVETAIKAARRIDSGYVWVNTAGGQALGTPYGGMKQSGYGRDKVIEEMLSNTHVKNIAIAL